jgi:dienelactone hydrolase
MARRDALVMLALWTGAAVLAGCTVGGLQGPTIATTTPAGTPEWIPIQIQKPDGAGPFPAVVIMHDCSGLGPRSSGAPGRWATELVGRGYVVLMPDSFTTRGFPAGVCTNPSPRRSDVGPSRRVRDAHAALAHLRTLPFVDGSRVGLMGGSHGGTATLATMVAPSASPGFRAGVALYPGCASWLRIGTTGADDVYRPAGPLLILIGEKDDWTPAEPCRRLAEAAQRAGSPVTIKVYPGAYHSFDSANPVRYVATRVNASSPTGQGATTGGDPEAWADSIREVAAFFGRYLK